MNRLLLILLAASFGLTAATAVLEVVAGDGRHSLAAAPERAGI